MKRIDFYVANWCPDGERSKAYLKENRINFNFINVDVDREGDAIE